MWHSAFRTCSGACLPEEAFSQAFVPIASTRAQHGEEATRQTIDHVATLLVWVLLLTCIVGVAAAPVLVWAMASRLKQDPRGFEAAVHDAIDVPYIGFMSFVALSAGVLNTWKRFAVFLRPPPCC